MVALLLTSAALGFLLWSPSRGSRPVAADAETPPHAESVQFVGPGLVRILPDSPLGKKLEVAQVSSVKMSTPLLTVTGSVVARLRPGTGPAEDRWQFSSPELLSAYTDWRKSNADVDFTESQLAKTRKLASTRVTRQTEVVDRLRKLVAAGTDAPKDLAAEETNLMLAEIQGDKDVHEAETAVKVAKRNRAALERQLFQAGADPYLLGRAPEGTAIIVADVPEAKLGLVREGQGCQAWFFGFPGLGFPGRVSSLAPTISKERRTLRVLFELADSEDRLKPGMFADVGLGTDPRQALLAPTDGILHVGLGDFMLVGSEPGVWKVTGVRVGEVQGSRVEMLQGVKAGERVLGKGAILLKPFVVQAVQGSKKPLPDTASPTGEKTGL
jgi:hypothetical protein